MFSIIVPIYNAEDSIEKILDSVFNQKYPNWELILIDDGSTDNSAEIITKKYLTDKRVKLIQQNNSGVSSARNVGIEYATKEYIIFLDSDDFIELDYLKTVKNIVDSYKPDVISFGYKKHMNNINKEYLPIIEGYYNKQEFSKVFKKFEKVNINTVWARVYKKKLLTNNDLYFEKMKIGEDAVFNYNVYSKMNNIYIEKQAFYNYVVRTNSAMKSYNKNNFSEQLYLLQRYKVLLDSLSLSYEDKNKLIAQKNYSIIVSELKNINTFDSTMLFSEKTDYVSQIISSKEAKHVLQNLNSSDFKSILVRITLNLIENRNKTLLVILYKLYMKLGI